MREDRRVVCARRHSFDVARSGYFNLLQPQERRSRHPGDSVEVMAARRRLHERGITAPLLDAIADLAGINAADIVLDAGCGDGFYLGSLAARVHCQGHGIDISVPSIDAAARRYPGCEWIVGNADRFLPYTDGSFSLVLSITARMNALEFHRVLRPDGRLLVALAAPDDLIEWRGAGRDRVPRTVETFAGAFELVSHRRATTTAVLDTDGVNDVLVSMYRPMQARPVEPGSLTFSLDLLLFR